MSLALLAFALQLIEVGPNQVGPNQQPPQVPVGDGVIEVVVTNSVSHEPVRKAYVGIYGPFAGASSVTDASGKAVFERLPDGQFTVQAGHPNYPPPRRFGAFRQQVELKPGERKRRISIGMIPAAALAGRIVDQDGDPVAQCNVQAMRRDPMQKGRITGFGNAQTKPNGEYRLFNLAAGRYYVAANCQGPFFIPHPLSDRPPRATVRYLAQVYPGAEDFASAAIIDLAPGSERSGVDFRMVQGPVSSALVKLFPPGHPSGGPLQVLMVSRDPFAQSLQGMQAGGFNPVVGGYWFERLLPGSYDLVAFTAQGGKAYGGRMAIEVESGKTAEISLPVGPGADLAGRLEMDDGSPVSGGAQVFLQALGDSPMPGGQQPAKVEDGGAFTISGLLPGRWRVRAYGLPNNGYVKSISFGDRDLPDRIIDVASGTGGGLRIVVGTKGGTVEGSVTGDGAQIVLFSESGDEEQIRSAVTQGTRYRFTNVPPGKYRLAALGSLSMGISSDMGSALAPLSKAIEVEEGSSVTEDLKVLSGEEIQKALSADPE